MWRCQAIRHSSLWIVQYCHECGFPSSTTPPAWMSSNIRNSIQDHILQSLRRVDLHSPEPKTVCLIYQITKQQKEQPSIFRRGHKKHEFAFFLINILPTAALQLILVFFLLSVTHLPSQTFKLPALLTSQVLLTSLLNLHQFLSSYSCPPGLQNLAKMQKIKHIVVVKSACPFNIWHIEFCFISNSKQ